MVAPGAVAAADIQPDRPIRVVDSLGVNASNTERNVAYGKCEQEGVAEIASLLKQSSIEEMWAFLPRRQPSGSCQWHEIGRNEKTGTDEAYVDVDWAYLEALMEGNESVYLYHFHPLAFFDFARSSPSDGSDESFRREIVSDLKFSMPSPADIHFMMEITSRFYLRHPGGGDFRNRVVTPYGIVDYALTEAGRVKYESDKDARTQGLYIKYVAASALDDESIEAIVAEHSNDIARSMKRLVAVLNTRYLRIAFSPFAKN
jgi:hypothetical protein